MVQVPNRLIGDETRPVCNRCCVDNFECDGYKIIVIQHEVRVFRIKSTKPLLSKTEPCRNQSASIVKKMPLPPAPEKTKQGKKPCCHWRPRISSLDNWHLPDLYVLRDPTTTVFQDANEYGHFRFFLERTSINFKMVISSQIWQTVLPQASYEERFVKHSISLFAAVHMAENDRACGRNEDANRHMAFAWESYDLSLRLMKQSLATSDETYLRNALLGCLLTCLAELLAGNKSQSIKQAVLGIDLLSDRRLRGSGSSCLIDSDIVEATRSIQDILILNAMERVSLSLRCCLKHKVL